MKVLLDKPAPVLLFTMREIEVAKTCRPKQASALRSVVVVHGVESENERVDDEAVLLAGLGFRLTLEYSHCVLRWRHWPHTGRASSHFANSSIRILCSSRMTCLDPSPLADETAIV